MSTAQTVLYNLPGQSEMNNSLAGINCSYGIRMAIIRFLLVLCILNFFTSGAYPTGQAGDIIIWKNKKYQLYSNPLESCPGFALMRNKIFGDQPTESSTACVRGYVAEWKIINNHLYLTNIFACNDLSIKADLNILFPDKVKNGRIKADWVNEILLVPEGKCIYYGNIGYDAIYETEYGITIKKGKVTEIVKYDNSKSHISVFTQKPDSLTKFIEQNIQWTIIPDTINKPVRVDLVIISTGTNKPEIRITGGTGIKLYDDEALRVASLIPDWDFYFQRGKIYRRFWALSIVFCKEKKLKYTY